MAFDRKNQSRFKLTESIITSSGHETYGLLKKFRFLDKKNLSEDEIGQITITSELAGKPWKIAEQIYGRTDLYTILILFNQIRNPFEYPNGWPTVNQTIYYPVPILVLAEL